MNFQPRQDPGLEVNVADLKGNLYLDVISKDGQTLGKFLVNSGYLHMASKTWIDLITADERKL
jgi:hypothetical protein